MRPPVNCSTAAAYSSSVSFLPGLHPCAAHNRLCGAEQIPRRITSGKVGHDKGLGGAFHGVRGAVDKLALCDGERGSFQRGRHDEEVRDELERAALAVEEPHHRRTRCGIALDGELLGALVGNLFPADGVFGGEKGLAVIAELRETGLQKAEDQLVGVLRRALPEHLDGRRIEPDLVVLDRVARDADRPLEVLVLDGVRAAREVLDFTLPAPFLHAGNVAEPRIIFLRCRGRAYRRDTLVKDRRLGKRFIKQGIKPDVNPPKGLRCDNHLIVSSLFRFCRCRARSSQAEAHLDRDALVIDADDKARDAAARVGLADGLVVLDIARLEDVGRVEFAARAVLIDEHAARDKDALRSVRARVGDGLLGPACDGQVRRLGGRNRISVRADRHDRPLKDGRFPLDRELDALRAVCDLRGVPLGC